MADISEQGGTKGRKVKVSQNKVEHKNDVQPKKKVVSKKCEKEKVENKKIINKIKSKVAPSKRKTTTAPKKKSNSYLFLDSNETMDSINRQSQEANDSEWLNDNGSSTVINEATVKIKEKRIRQKCESWQLTREEITSVPTLIKPTIKPIDDKVISNMAEKMMKKLKENQNSPELKKTETSVNSKNEQTATRTSKKKGKDKPSSHNRKDEYKQTKNSKLNHDPMAKLNTKSASPNLSMGSKQISEGVLKKKQGNFKISKELESSIKKSDADLAEGKLIGSQMTESNGIISEAKTSDKIHPHLAQAKNLDKKGSKDAVENSAHHSSDKVLENASYEASNDKLCENIKHRDILDKQDESKDNTEKSLKTTKCRFSVPIKRKIHDTSSNQKTSRKTLNNETEPLHKVSSDNKTKMGDSRQQTTYSVRKGKHLKSINNQCQLALPEYDINVGEYENATKKSEDTLHLEYRNQNSIENKDIPYDSSKDISINFYNTPFKDEISAYSTKLRGTFKCLDDGEQRLDEIISFQQASEIIANSFVIESPKVRQRFEMNQESGKVKPSSDEKQASPLVSGYDAESVKFLDIFKAMSPDREGKFKNAFLI